VLIDDQNQNRLWVEITCEWLLDLGIPWQMIDVSPLLLFNCFLITLTSSLLLVLAGLYLFTRMRISSLLPLYFRLQVVGE
jgi:hypothetical protein